MAETRYPVIDYLTCTECGTCVVMCPHGVYDTEKTPSPVVKNIESCIDHCHSCGNRCPVGAITYIGDGTGWRPPKIKKPPPAVAETTAILKVWQRQKKQKLRAQV